MKDPDENLVLAFIVRMPGQKADELLTEFVQHEMTKRLTEKRNEGYSGWNTSDSRCENSLLRERLLKNVEKGNWIDVINLAAMLLAREKMFYEVPYTQTVNHT